MKKSLALFLTASTIIATCCSCGSSPSFEKLSGENPIIEYQVTEGITKSTYENSRPKYSGTFTSLPVFKTNPKDSSAEDLKKLYTSFGVEESDYINLTNITDNPYISPEKKYSLYNDVSMIKNTNSENIQTIVDKFANVKWLESRLTFSYSNDLQAGFTSDTEKNFEVWITDRENKIFSDEINYIDEIGSEDNFVSLKALIANHSDIFDNSYSYYGFRDSSRVYYKDEENNPPDFVSAYEKKPETDLELLLDYSNICNRVDLNYNYNGTFELNKYSNECYESIGDYPIISEDEANERLKNDQYCGANKFGMAGENFVYKYTDGDEVVLKLNLVYGRDTNNNLRPVYMGQFIHKDSQDESKSGEYQVWVDAIKY